MTTRATAPRTREAEKDKMRSQLERFGSLLTERQHAMMRGYAVDGLSFSEIARQHNISRQAVHEAVRGAQRILVDYEAKLAHLGATGAGTADLTQVFTKLENLKLKIARTGIIYSVDWIRREIDTVMGMLADQNNDGTNKTGDELTTDSSDQSLLVNGSAA